MKKQCTKCLRFLDIEKFNKDSQKKDGRYSSCKSCVSKKEKDYRYKNQELLKEKSKKYYQENKNKIRDKIKKTYLEDPVFRETHINRNKKYYDDNKEAISKRGFIYRKNNIDKIIERNKKRYIKIKENEPWRLVYFRLKERCKKGSLQSRWYFEKGIRAEITEQEVKYLWFRDNAINLSRPSIDRINSNGNYTLNNCRFIELSENVRRAVTKKLSYDHIVEMLG
jgi:hypothetical protein